MNILDIAIKAEDGISNLARAIGTTPNTIGNWRTRGSIPKGWAALLSDRYKKHIKLAEKAAA